MAYINGNPQLKTDLERLNLIIEDWCNTVNDKKETLSLESTFKEVADFLNYFEAFESRYKIKKTSPDFKVTLGLWISEIEKKLNIENKEQTRLFGDNVFFTNRFFDKIINSYFNMETFAYLKTAQVDNCILYDLKEYLFKTNWNGDQRIEENDIDIFFHGNLLEKIARGFVYAHKLPELKEELIELSKIESKPVDNISQINLINIKSKILVLRELGIINLLNQKFNSNNTNIAKCIGSIINEKHSSIRGILSNINGNLKSNTNPENTASLENAIIVLNDLGCSDEVVILQNKLAKLI